MQEDIDIRKSREGEQEYQPPTSAEELLSRYAAGERYFPEADMPDGSDFSKAHLAGAVLERCWLSDANFTGADLRRVSFRGTNLKCADFRDANLEGSIWTGASVEVGPLRERRI